MKKLIVAFVGSILFVAGYFQVHRQTEYVSTKAMQVNPAPSTQPMTIPVKTGSTFAFRLDRAFLNN